MVEENLYLWSAGCPSSSSGLPATTSLRGKMPMFAGRLNRRARSGGAFGGQHEDGMNLSKRLCPSAYRPSLARDRYDS